MSSQEKGRPLPKFGEWDVNNPASAEGFTVIFNKARDEKKTNSNAAAGAGAGAGAAPRHEVPVKPDPTYEYPRKSRRWLCCG